MALRKTGSARMPEWRRCIEALFVPFNRHAVSLFPDSAEIVAKIMA
jgi:hypothetical protein